MRFLATALSVCLLATGALAAVVSQPEVEAVCVQNFAFSTELVLIHNPFFQTSGHGHHDDTRTVVQKYIRAQATRNFTELLALGAPGATFFFAGLTSQIPLAGTASYEERITQQLPPLLGSFGTFNIDTLGITVQGDTAVAETHDLGTGAAGTPQAGRTYDNLSLTKFVVKNGKIESVREYVDFFAVFNYLGS